MKHKVVGATWVQNTGKWRVAVESLETGETIREEAEILINAGGFVK